MSHRIPKFITVGAIGFLIQLGSLALLTMAVGWTYGPATAIAVQLAVLHNFLWHERWTWRDRTASGTFPQRAPGSRRILARFARYEITTGATSLAGNLLGTALFVEYLGIPLLAANTAAVAAMSVANFLLADRWVFAPAGSWLNQKGIRAALHRRSRWKNGLASTAAISAGMAALATLSASHVSAAELRPETVAAWNRYVADTETGFSQRRTSDVRGDQPQGDATSIPGGRIHHWRGSTVIRGITVDALVHSLMNPGTPPPQEDILESRVLARSNDSVRLYLKLVRRTIMTVTYDTEHLVTFRREGPGLASSRSVSTRIAEVDGRDRGFLWRLNAYWRYVQVGADVRVDLESVSLSREVPSMLKPVAAPVITRIARESVTKALDALREFFDNN